jgi:hypothetical protein
VRVETAVGRSYPTVPVTACQPVVTTGEEAIEMGFAAVHAGDALLARLWLLRAGLAGGELGERGELLAELLR